MRLASRCKYSAVLASNMLFEKTRKHGARPNLGHLKGISADLLLGQSVLMPAHGTTRVRVL
jgi:hypothetical protein